MCTKSFENIAALLNWNVIDIVPAIKSSTILHLGQKSNIFDIEFFWHCWGYNFNRNYATERPPGVLYSLATCITVHTHIEGSHKPEIILLPSAENATEVTVSVCPFMILSWPPFDVSHIRTEQACDPEANHALLAENATELTESV